MKTTQSQKKLLSIAAAVAAYLDSVRLARSENTFRTYSNALTAFNDTLAGRGIEPAENPVQELPEDAVAWLAADLKSRAPATESLYLTAAAGFYSFLAAERLASVNLPRVRLLIRQRSRRPGRRLPQFPRQDIEKLLDYAKQLSTLEAQNSAQSLRNRRDRAFLITLADTGLRVHEACGMRRGDLDWNESRALITGKGNQQAVVRFSQRAISALKSYLAARAGLDGSSGRPLASLPLFARHDRGAGKKVKPISTVTGRNIVKQRAIEALGEKAAANITPHSFRHYFVTTVLRGSGGNLKLAQELARHRNIAVTQRYAHLSDEELDRGYFEVFED